MKFAMSLSSAALLSLAACAPANDPEEDTGAVVVSEGEEMVMPAPQETDCPVIESRNWSAWVNAMPGPDAKLTLHVTGDVDLPTPGYEVSWREGMADRSATPVQRLMLTLTPPEGMVTQVITTETVTYEGPALTKTYGGVIVMCGGAPLATIDAVVTAQ
ncbi:hypothetical protein ACFOOP_09020 [Marinicaulis aureus]|uniref:Lipoprotein n=1 Tax=Hyphococcus aureus TaxID=2666033 RepID=A0ABW1KTU6_9PROT